MGNGRKYTVSLCREVGGVQGEKLSDGEELGETTDLSEVETIVEENSRARRIGLPVYWRNQLANGGSIDERDDEGGAWRLEVRHRSTA